MTHRDRLVVDVLVVPHHGSRTSDPAFLVATGARTAVLSVGAGNRHEHPHPDTLATLEAAGMDLHRTDRDGTFRIAVRRG